MATLGIPIFRRSAWATDEPAHSRFETDDRTPSTWQGSNLYVHIMAADFNNPAAGPFEVGDFTAKGIRTSGGGGGGGGVVQQGARDVTVQPWFVDFNGVAQPITVAALPLPAGAATEATLATRASEATLAGVLTTAAFQARINTLGQKAMATSTPVVIASDQSALPVTGTFWQATQPVSVAALPLPAGAATEATLATRLADATFTGRFPAAAALSDAFANPTVTQIGAFGMLFDPVAGTWRRTIGFPTNADTLGTQAAFAYPPSVSHMLMFNGTSWDRVRGDTTSGLDVDLTRWLGSTAPTVGQKVAAFSLPVVLASDQPGIPIGTPPDLAASAPTAAAVGAASVSIVAANAARKGLTLTLTTPGGRVSLAFDGAAAVLDSGDTLYGPGGVFHMDERCFTTGEVRAIADAAGRNVAIQEYV